MDATTSVLGVLALGGGKAKTRLSVDIDKATQNRFKASCNVHGQSLSERLAEVMRADADRSGIPAATGV